MTSCKRQSRQSDTHPRGAASGEGAVESGDRHEVCSECNNNNDGRGAILQGYKAESIVKSSENDIQRALIIQKDTMNT